MIKPDICRITSSVARHTITIPTSERLSQACIKLESLGISEKNASMEPTSNKCWIVDDFLVTTDSRGKSLLFEDFDTFNPSNWLHFQGSEIEVS